MLKIDSPSTPTSIAPVTTITKPGKTEITLFRHVKVAGANALYGQTDVEANIEQNNQAFDGFVSASPDTLFVEEQDAGEQEKLLQRFDFILTSPLQRRKLLAKRLSESSNIPCIELPGFQEMNFGDYDGLAFESLGGTFLETENKGEMDIESKGGIDGKNWQVLEKFWQDPANNTLPNAESLLAFKQRIEKNWQQLLTQYQGKKLLLVTHGGVIRMILAHILPLDWQHPSLYQSLKISNASLTKINRYQHFCEEPICDQAIENDHCEVEFIGLPLF